MTNKIVAEQIHAHNHFAEIGGDVADATVTAGAVFGIRKTVDDQIFRLRE